MYENESKLGLSRINRDLIEHYELVNWNSGHELLISLPQWIVLLALEEQKDAL